ncbi:beta strand repeat-containing protein [Bradyrhizobium sp. RDM4]|uniref:beta strand repeat-containing protein n=1 Tax=Bradyrhizobium sp. RDM4 TaxID=3378765 RepID=UPI0038FC6466
MTDDAGNTKPVTGNDFVLDTTADSDNNLAVSAVTHTGGVNHDAVSVILAGIDSDVVSGTVTLSDGTNSAVYHLSAADIAAGSVTLGADAFTGFAGLSQADGTIHVAASVTDDAGNTKPVTGNDFVLDTTADSDNNLAVSAVTHTGGVNHDAVSVTLAGIDSDVVSGTVTLSDGTNSAVYHLSAADIAAGSVTLGADAFTGFAGLSQADGTIHVAASVTDDAGNTKPVTGNDFVLDTTADSDNNLAVSAVTHTGGVNHDAVSVTLAGIDSDVVSGTVTLSDGTNSAVYHLSAADIAAGSVTLGADAFTGFAGLSQADGTIHVAASVTDDAGNTKPVTGNDFVLDTTADSDNNLAVSAVTHTGGVNHDAVSVTLAGIDSDVVSGTVTLSDGTNSAVYHLSAADIAAGSVTLGADAFTGFAGLSQADGTIHVAASVTDDAGNTKPVTGNDFVLDTTADSDNNLAVSAVTHTGGVNHDAVSVTLAGIDSDVVSGTVTLSDGTNSAVYHLSAADIAAGSVTLGADAFTGFAGLSQADGTIHVAASVTDDAGNTKPVTGNDFVLDTTADSDNNLAVSAVTHRRRQS